METNSERLVLKTLVRQGVPTLAGGQRNQSFDIRIPHESRAFARQAGLEAGDYEVKSLWRKREGRAFDPRFKVGQRGERIYGTHDSLIKAFAVALETQIDYMLEHSVKYPSHPRRPKGELTAFVEETHSFLDQAVQRRHSKAFALRLERLARVSQHIPTMLPIARKLLYDRVQASDIVGGFSDIEGIFVVAGHMYTLVTRGEIPEFLAFDSVSSEGLKLRFVKEIPREKSVQEENRERVEDGV